MIKVKFDLNRNISDLWSHNSSGFVRQFFVGQPEMTCQRTEYSRSNQVLLTNKFYNIFYQSVETLFQTNDKNFVMFNLLAAAHDLKNQLFNK
ncbi:hypothetical protein T10_2120 [Trichinella papuae]|uniref:Uncharacterized protein n=1 Tax=Trichinella papuae TaxID=268474 RepID=A0A0V1N1M2_9BILA|nr:hypothetical protein T10_2120 [Trichinella papuae]